MALRKALSTLEITARKLLRASSSSAAPRTSQYDCIATHTCSTERSAAQRLSLGVTIRTNKRLELNGWREGCTYSISRAEGTEAERWADGLLLLLNKLDMRKAMS